jgi:hypothetical protein
MSKRRIKSHELKDKDTTEEISGKENREIGANKVNQAVKV